MKRWIAAVAVFGWLWTLWMPPAVSAEEKREFRAFWVDAFHDGFKTPEQVDQLIRDVQQANANAIIVQVRRRGDAYFNRALEPRTQDPALQPGFDALAYMIEKAHRAEPRIEVHAWLATLPIWNSAIPPQSDDHVFNRHGPGALGRDYWLMERVDGANRHGADYVLDPGHPDAVDYTVEQYVNVVRQYPVDGIHLDLVRYMGDDWGYNPISLQRYREQTGRLGKPEPRDEQWKKWRRTQVDHLMRKVYLKSVALRPDIKVSAAVIAWGAGPASMEDYEQSAPVQQVMQDWNGWLQAGIIDLAIPMNYDREHVPEQRAWYDQWIEWEKDHQYHRQIAAGPGVYLNSIEGSLAQIQRALAPSRAGNRLGGVSLYSYAVTNKDGLPNETLYTALSDSPVFAEPAVPPDMPWKTRPKKGHVMGQAWGENGEPLDAAEVVIRGKNGETYRTQTDGSGFFGLADLPPGHYVVKADKPFEETPAQSVWIEKGKVSETEIRAKGNP